MISSRMRINGQIFIYLKNICQTKILFNSSANMWQSWKIERQLLQIGKMQITDIALSTFSNSTNRKSGSVFARSQLVVHSWIPVLKRENVKRRAKKCNVTCKRLCALQIKPRIIILHILNSSLYYDQYAITIYLTQFWANLWKAKLFIKNLSLNLKKKFYYIK